MNKQSRLAVSAMLWVGMATAGLFGASRGMQANGHRAATKSTTSAFSRGPFTADMTIVGKQGTYHGKMYAGPNALRTDVRLPNGVTASVIVRYDKRVEWILIPGRHYIEAPIDEGNDLLGALRDQGARVEKQDLGPGKVGIYPCEKFRVKVSDKGRNLSGWIWVARAKAMNGFIVKAQDEASSESVELNNIRLAPPDASLFRLPAGYHQLRSPSKVPGAVH